MSKKKFKIMYPDDHYEVEKRGEPYHPPQECMVVMNGSGVFFLYYNTQYYPWIRPLSEVLPKYDVVWK